MKVCGAAAESDSDSEQALAQLKPEQSAVGDAKGGASRFGEVVAQHRLGAMPRPSAAAELPDVVEARPCVQVSHHIDAGSDGYSTVDERWAGLDTQALVVQEHPPPHLIMVELRLAGCHVSLLGVVVLLASNSAEHVKLLADTTSYWTEPRRENNNMLGTGTANLDNAVFGDVRLCCHVDI